MADDPHMSKPRPSTPAERYGANGLLPDTVSAARLVETMRRVLKGPHSA
jgi:hypothetical protein